MTLRSDFSILVSGTKSSATDLAHPRLVSFLGSSKSSYAGIDETSQNELSRTIAKGLLEAEPLNPGYDSAVGFVSALMSSDKGLDDTLQRLIDFKRQFDQTRFSETSSKSFNAYKNSLVRELKSTAYRFGLNANSFSLSFIGADHIEVNYLPENSSDKVSVFDFSLVADRFIFELNNKDQYPELVWDIVRICFAELSFNSPFGFDYREKLPADSLLDSDVHDEYLTIISRINDRTGSPLRYFVRKQSNSQIKDFILGLIDGGAKYYYNEFEPGTMRRKHIKTNIMDVLARINDNGSSLRIVMNPMSRRDLAGKWYLECIIEPILAPIERSQNSGMLSIESEFTSDNYAVFKKVFKESFAREFDFKKA